MDNFLGPVGVRCMLYGGFNVGIEIYLSIVIKATKTRAKHASKVDSAVNIISRQPPRELENTLEKYDIRFLLY